MQSVDRLNGEGEVAVRSASPRVHDREGAFGDIHICRAEDRVGRARQRNGSRDGSRREVEGRLVRVRQPFDDSRTTREDVDGRGRCNVANGQSSFTGGNAKGPARSPGWKSSIVSAPLT